MYIRRSLSLYLSCYLSSIYLTTRIYLSNYASTFLACSTQHLIGGFCAWHGYKKHVAHN